MVFPGVMYACESWTIKKAEHWRIDAFELWCWRSLFPLDCKEIQPVHPKGDQSVLNIHWKDWCWSWNSNILASWWEELTHLKRPQCWERLKAGDFRVSSEGDYRGWDGWMVSLTQWTWVRASSRSWWWTGRPGMLRSTGIARSQTWLSDWTAKAR